ncbi:MAG: coenzyme F420-0:L-glutamate ligase [Candidatus Moraniibacteriota bacterium]|nr:MAG: coenzyme F420-0:L-glutamate ligase [Candidatus Moranbacteria bacterium]
MNVDVRKTRIFTEGESLLPFLREFLPSLPERSVLVVTSKIVALAEGRVEPFSSDARKEELIREESEFAIHTKYCWLTVRQGIPMPSSGIDESNGDGKLILLPKDSFRSAALLREELKESYGVRSLGVIISDSRTLPFRAGVVGVALGYAGFRGVRDYRGKPDIFGRLLRLSRTDVADSLAASAVLGMGEGNEQCPLAVITDPPVEFCEVIDPSELSISVEDDMYGPLFSGMKGKGE